MAIITFPTPPKIEIQRFDFKIETMDKYFLIFFAIWGLTLLLTLVTILTTYSRLPLEIPLFYSRIWGENQLAAKTFIFLPPSGAFFLGLFSNAVALHFLKIDKVMTYLLAGTASLIAILSAITIINIIRLLL